MDQTKELEKTFIEEYAAAMLLEHEKFQKASLILFSKSLFALADYIIFKKYNKLPKNHTERFRILENKEPNIYSAVNSVWSKYIGTYSKPSANESIGLFKKIIRELTENEGISEDIKKAIKQ